VQDFRMCPRRRTNCYALRVDIMESFKDYNYPRFSYIENLRPSKEILLGREIYWTEKRDGSCLGIGLTEGGEWLIRSRNQEQAANDLKAAFLASPESEAVREFIEHGREFGEEYAVFGELLQPGKSPARFEMHERHEFVAFDAMCIPSGEFITYPALYQRCYQADLPIVPLYSKSIHYSMENLLEYRDSMLEIADSKGREGVVAKTWDSATNMQAICQPGNFIYVKEKLDALRVPIVTDADLVGMKPILPPLPESEIYTAIVAVRDELGEQFADPRIAMPRIADALKNESQKHCRANVKNMFKYYQDVLRGD